MICSECYREAVDPVKPGPEWLWCCRACFARVDAFAEALEHGAIVAPPDMEAERRRPARRAGPGRPAWTQQQHVAHAVKHARARLAARGIHLPEAA